MCSSTASPAACTWCNSSPYPRHVSDPTSAFATPRVAAGALFLDPAGRVLLVHPTYKDSWDIPGGYVEQGESPAAACRREVAEELGLDRQPRRLLAVDWAPHEREGDKLLFLFDCGDLADDQARIRLDPTETRPLAVGCSRPARRLRHPPPGPPHPHRGHTRRKQHGLPRTRRASAYQGVNKQLALSLDSPVS